MYMCNLTSTMYLNEASIDVTIKVSLPLLEKPTKDLTI